MILDIRVAMGIVQFILLVHGGIMTALILT